jgi:hypothetical protein
MIQSQVVAKPRRGRPKEPLPWYMHETNRKSLRPDERTNKLQRQVEACKTTAARRLILGTSR